MTLYRPEDPNEAALVYLLIRDDVYEGIVRMDPYLMAEKLSALGVKAPVADVPLEYVQTRYRAVYPETLTEDSPFAVREYRVQPRESQLEASESAVSYVNRQLNQKGLPERAYVEKMDLYTKNGWETYDV